MHLVLINERSNPAKSQSTVSKILSRQCREAIRDRRSSTKRAIEAKPIEREAAQPTNVAEPMLAQRGKKINPGEYHDDAILARYCPARTQLKILIAISRA
jgi:hypothetical protein